MMAKRVSKSDHWTIRRLLGWLSLALIAAGVCLLSWGLLPLPQAAHALEIPAAKMSAPGEAGSALQAVRRMELNYPRWQRAGDPAAVRLTFSPLEVQGSPPETDSAYAVFVETRLESAGLGIDPHGTSGQILPAGRTVVFWWQIMGDQAGGYEATAWLSLRFTPGRAGDTGAGEFTQALAAPRLQFHVQRLLGLSGPAARWIGAISILIGASGALWRWFYA